MFYSDIHSDFTMFLLSVLYDENIMSHICYCHSWIMANFSIFLAAISFLLQNLAKPNTSWNLQLPLSHNFKHCSWGTSTVRDTSPDFEQRTCNVLTPYIVEWVGNKQDLWRELKSSIYWKWNCRESISKFSSLAVMQSSRQQLSSVKYVRKLENFSSPPAVIYWCHVSTNLNGRVQEVTSFVLHILTLTYTLS